jgi:LysM repeat protein
MRFALRISYAVTLLWLVSCGGTFQVGILSPTDSPVGPTEPSTSVSALTPAWTVASNTTATVTPQGSATATATLTQTSPAIEVTNTTTVTPCVTPAKWTTYTVKPGDTLFDLSQQTNIGVQQLRQANCLSTDIIRTGQQIYLPFLPTATFTPTLTPTPTPPLPTVDPLALFSPNGKRYATNGGVVVDVEQRRVIGDILNPTSLTIWRWTNDSRYAIFGRKNQFNSTYTYVFDTLAWKLVYSTNGCSVQPNTTTLTDACGDYPFTQASNAPRFVMENGVLVDLTTLQSTDLLATKRPAQPSLVAGSWSPDGTYLTWVAADSTQTAFILYLANGDGTGVQALATLDGRPTGLQWFSATKATVNTATGTYTVDAIAGTVETDATATVTPSPTASATPSP